MLKISVALAITLFSLALSSAASQSEPQHGIGLHQIQQSFKQLLLATVIHEPNRTNNINVAISLDVLRFAFAYSKIFEAENSEDHIENLVRMHICLSESKSFSSVVPQKQLDRFFQVLNSNVDIWTGSNFNYHSILSFGAKLEKILLDLQFARYNHIQKALRSLASNGVMDMNYGSSSDFVESIKNIVYAEISTASKDPSWYKNYSQKDQNMARWGTGHLQIFVHDFFILPVNGEQGQLVYNLFEAFMGSPAETKIDFFIKNMEEYHTRAQKISKTDFLYMLHCTSIFLLMSDLTYLYPSLQQYLVEFAHNQPLGLDTLSLALNHVPRIFKATAQGHNVVSHFFDLMNTALFKSTSLTYGLLVELVLVTAINTYKAGQIDEDILRVVAQDGLFCKWKVNGPFLNFCESFNPELGDYLFNELQNLRISIASKETNMAPFLGVMMSLNAESCKGLLQSVIRNPVHLLELVVVARLAPYGATFTDIDWFNAILANAQPELVN